MYVPVSMAIQQKVHNKNNINTQVKVLHLFIGLR